MHGVSGAYLIQDGGAHEPAVVRYRLDEAKSGRLSARETEEIRRSIHQHSLCTLGATTSQEHTCSHANLSSSVLDSHFDHTDVSKRLHANRGILQLMQAMDASRPRMMCAENARTPKTKPPKPSVKHICWRKWLKP